MAVYDMYINKKRKEVPKKSRFEQVDEMLQACKKAQEYFHSITDGKEKAKTISIVKKKEAMAKVKGYEACRNDEDIPMLHKMIREIEHIRVDLTKNPN